MKTYQPNCAWCGKPITLPDRFTTMREFHRVAGGANLSYDFVTVDVPYHEACIEQMPHAELMLRTLKPREAVAP